MSLHATGETHRRHTRKFCEHVTRTRNGHAMLIHMRKQRLSFVLLIIACSPDGTTVTTAITTSATSLTSASTDDTSTTGETGLVPTSGDSSTTSTATTSLNDFDCLPPEPTPEMPDPPYLCSQAPTVDDFCSYLSTSCAEHEIEPTYCEILADKCGDPIRCTACFYLANTCSQIGVACENLGYECACVAEVAL